MPTDKTLSPNQPPPSVFLSYASEDRAAARAIRDALATTGLDVWYDESDLDGGDVWDQKIRRQIRECDFFVPIVSAQTETRAGRLLPPGVALRRRAHARHGGRSRLPAAHSHR